MPQEEPSINPTPAVNPEDNTTIRQLRAAQETAAAAAKTEKERADGLEAQLKEIERSKMAESDRLKAELEDARKEAQEVAKLREENGRFASAFQSNYEAELAAIPEEHRERVTKLTGAGTYADRLGLLREVKALLPASGPAPAGSVTRPGATPTGTPPETAKHDFKQGPPGWGFKEPPSNGSA